MANWLVLDNRVVDTTLAVSSLLLPILLNLTHLLLLLNLNLLSLMLPLLLVALENGWSQTNSKQVKNPFAPMVSPPPKKVVSHEPKSYVMLPTDMTSLTEADGAAKAAGARNLEAQILLMLLQVKVLTRLAESTHCLKPHQLNQMHHQSQLMSALASGSEQANSKVEKYISVQFPLVMNAPIKSKLTAQDSIWQMLFAEKVTAAGARNPMEWHLMQLQEA
jgi:hypothetical protein